MAVNKVVFGSEVLVDLTADTVTSADLVDGVTAHNKAGAVITGSLQISKVYTGSSTPSDSVGVDGDLYLQIGG